VLPARQINYEIFDGCSKEHLQNSLVADLREIGQTMIVQRTRLNKLLAHDHKKSGKFGQIYEQKC